MTITCIRVPAAWVHEGTSRTSRAEFLLGPGPCGKTVSMLESTFKDGCLCILQVHDDGTYKRFLYPLEQLLGRIEIEYA